MIIFGLALNSVQTLDLCRNFLHSEIEWMKEDSYIHLKLIQITAIALLLVLLDVINLDVNQSDLIISALPCLPSLVKTGVQNLKMFVL